MQVALDARGLPSCPCGVLLPVYSGRSLGSDGAASAHMCPKDAVGEYRSWAFPVITRSPFH